MTKNIWFYLKVILWVFLVLDATFLGFVLLRWLESLQLSTIIILGVILPCSILCLGVGIYLLSTGKINTTYTKNEGNNTKDNKRPRCWLSGIHHRCCKGTGGRSQESTNHTQQSRKEKHDAK